jgi:phenylpropionate dioxygenase-like ring-hydroxylating dioxygenase large terminal subunit
MLTREENELLTSTGPGTPMGELIRRYWIPALMSSEIPEPGGEPVQVRILGERLVAFRDSAGRVGLMDEACAHRGCSLWYARSEEGGLRCIYHGWKVDVEGNIVDTPNEPTTLHVRAHAYPVREAGGFVWAYMGPPERMPPFREFNWMKLPEGHVAIVKVHEEANYLQGIEGSVDTAHVSFLHRAYQRGMWGSTTGATVEDTRPRLEIEPTRYGFRYAAIRHPSDGVQNVRITPFILPFHTYVPARPGDTVLFHAYVPRDDTSNWAYDIRYRVEEPIDMAEHTQRLRTVELRPDFTKPRTYANRHLQDREAQVTKNFSGIVGIKNQDYAAVESMGPIIDRTKEHLSSSDAAVVYMRRLMLQAAQAVLDGQDPPGLAPGIPSDLIVSEDFDCAADRSWRDVTPLDPGLALAPASAEPALAKG